MRGFVTCLVGRCANLTKADDIIDDSIDETGTSLQDADSTNDKVNLEEINHINIQITDSRDIQVGDRDIQIDNSQTSVTDNSKSVQIYKNCVFKQCSHAEPITPPPPYNDQRSEQSEEDPSVPRMDTLKSDSDNRYTGQQALWK